MVAPKGYEEPTSRARFARSEIRKRWFEAFERLGSPWAADRELEPLELEQISEDRYFMRGGRDSPEWLAWVKARKDASGLSAVSHTFSRTGRGRQVQRQLDALKDGLRPMLEAYKARLAGNPDLEDRQAFCGTMAWFIETASNRNQVFKALQEIGKVLGLQSITIRAIVDDPSAIPGHLAELQERWAREDRALKSAEVEVKVLPEETP